MGTLSGRALAAIRDARPVPLAEAAPEAVPGWLVLTGRGSEVALYLADSDDLRADVASLRRALVEPGGPAGALLDVRWATARYVLGPDAGNVRVRRAIETILLAHLKPDWSADQLASPGARSTLQPPLQEKGEHA